MRRYLLFFTCLLLSYVALAQTGNLVVIKGTVKDSAKKEALLYVTVTMQRSGKDSALKSVLTKEDGTFELNAAKDTALVLLLAAVGYEEKRITVTPGEAGTDLGTILLRTTAGQLGDVVVRAAAIKPLIKQEADRIGYDVQADPENKVNTVLDMLRKVPMVSVDGNDNIKLKGSGNYKILMNGKPSSMVTNNPSDVFRSMPATNIVKIEIITTPPAKYDAEGLAGIINIITKKKLDDGYNGSINTRYNVVWGPGVNLNATYKQGKFGINGYVGYNYRPKTTSAFGFANEIYRPIQSSINQNGEQSRNGNNTYGNAEASFEIDTLNLLTGSIEFYKGNNANMANQFLQQTAGSTILQQQYQLVNGGNSNYHGNDLALNYEKGFHRSKEQLLTTSYKYSQSGNERNTQSNFYNRLNYTQPDFRQYNESGTKEHTAQVDYVHPVKILNIEAGAKAIFRNNYSHFVTDYYNDAAKNYVNDPAQTNDFDYQQNVYSLYNSYNLKLKKTVLKGGLRLEHTTVDAHFISTGSAVKQNYSNLVPSFAVQQTLNESNSLTFGYSQRIQRPGIWQLNPFVDRSNPKYIYVGNPTLQPVVNRSFEIGFSNFKKGSINPSVSYSFANNTVEQVTSVGADTVTISTSQNVGSNRRLNFDLNLNYPLTKKLNININAELTYVWLKGTYNSQFYYNKGYQGHLFTNTGYKFNKGYRLNLNAGFDSRYVLLQGKDNYYPSFSLSGSKTLWKEKGTISVYVNNPHQRFLRLDYYTRTPDFYQTNYNDNFYRNFGISFNYKFGKLSSDIKKNKRGISNDDASGGSRN